MIRGGHKSRPVFMQVKNKFDPLPAIQFKTKTGQGKIMNVYCIKGVPDQNVVDKFPPVSKVKEKCHACHGGFVQKRKYPFPVNNAVLRLFKNFPVFPGT